MVLKILQLQFLDKSFDKKVYKNMIKAYIPSFMLGTFASPNAKDSNFALPNARNTSMFVSLALGDANFSRFT